MIAEVIWEGEESMSVHDIKGFVRFTQRDYNSPVTVSVEIQGLPDGFHGFHVLVGTLFLLVCLMRARKGHLTPERHFGFEAAAWYWHFVDVVWLFLYIAIYWWGR